MPLATGTCALVFLYNKRHDFIIHVRAICFISIINTWLYLTHSEKIKAASASKLLLLTYLILTYYLNWLTTWIASTLLWEKKHIILKAQYKWHLCSFSTYTGTSLCTEVIHTYQITDLSSTKQREGATVTSVLNKSFWSN